LIDIEKIPHLSIIPEIDKGDPEYIGEYDFVQSKTVDFSNLEHVE
jgi:hypothetical protein